MPASPLASSVSLPTEETEPVTNAQKARALIAILETGSDGPKDVPTERLRDWANDLIRTVEAEKRKPTVGPAQRRRLFTKLPPKLTAATPHLPSVPQSQPSRLTLTAPMPHRTDTTVKSEALMVPATFGPEDVRKVIAATVDPATLSREHPAVIAMTLLGKPSIDQASALRSLPGGQVRAVHKALRHLQYGQSRAPADPSATQERATAING